MATEQFYTPEQIAERYKLSEKTLEGWRFRGVGPKFRKFGHLVRYAESDLAVWEQSCARTNTAQIVDVTA